MHGILSKGILTKEIKHGKSLNGNYNKCTTVQTIQRATGMSSQTYL